MHLTEYWPPITTLEKQTEMTFHKGKIFVTFHSNVPLWYNCFSRSECTQLTLTNCTDESKYKCFSKSSKFDHQSFLKCLTLFWGEGTMTLWKAKSRDAIEVRSEKINDHGESDVFLYLKHWNVVLFEWCVLCTKFYFSTVWFTNLL